MAEMLISGVVSKLADVAAILIAKEGSRLFELEENITWIEVEMKSIQSFLKDADKVESEKKGLAAFIWSIWHLAYDLEDIRDEYFPKLSPLLRNDLKGRLNCFWKANTVRDFALEIKKFRQRVEHISRMSQTYTLQDASGEEKRDPRTFSYEEVNVVGMDDDINKLEGWLIDKDLRHRVISITGLGGLGKTTLARRVFKNVREKFECSAWISVSQQPNRGKLLCQIAAQVGLTNKCEDNLVADLLFFLSKKRYVLVFDDIWQIESWRYLQNSILRLDLMNGSRIIITSRSRDICINIDGGKFLHELGRLNDEKSRELFFKMVKAAPQDNGEDSDFSHLQNICEKILKRCCGVPLAIKVTTGRLLSGKGDIDAWNGVLENIGEGEDEYLQIIALSYKDLPLRLKPCFLYFGLFLQGHNISASQLINLWAAERFIHGSGVRAVEDIGQDYLNYLIGRNLIEVVKRSLNGTVELCRIHDILHTICISEAREIDFFNTLNDVATRANRLALRSLTTYDSEVGNHVSPNLQTPNLRSLLWFDDLAWFSIWDDGLPSSSIFGDGLTRYPVWGDHLTSNSGSSVLGDFNSGKQVKFCLRSSKSLRVLVMWHNSLMAPI